MTALERAWAKRVLQPPPALLRLPWSQRGLCHTLSATWPWSALESGPETFPSPLSGSRLLLLQISAQKPQVLKKPVLTSLIYPLTTLGISPSKHRPQFTVFLLFLSLSKLETPGSQDLCLFCWWSDPHQFTQYLAQSRCSIFNRLTAYNMNVYVPTLYEFFGAHRCYPLPPKHLHTHCRLSSTDLSPVGEYGS